MLQLTSDDILLGKRAPDKLIAIENIAKDLIAKGLAAEGYEQGMLAREQQNSTYLGNGIAIPHGTTDTRDLVQNTGVQIHHFPEGVAWGNGNTAYLVIGIAAKSDEHLGILKQLTHVLSADGVENALKEAKDIQEILSLLNASPKKDAELLINETTITLDLPLTDMVSLTAVCAGKLKAAGAVDDNFISSIVLKPATFLGKRVCLVSSNIGVKQSAIGVIRAQTAFDFQDKKAQVLIVVASADGAHVAALENLMNLMKKQSLDEFVSSSSADMVKLLTETRRAGASRIFTIKNPHGLHARPGATLVNVVRKFDSKIWVANVSTDSPQVNAKSLMKVIALGVKQGHQLEFTIEGNEAEAALAEIGEAIDSGLGEKGV